MKKVFNVQIYTEVFIYVYIHTHMYVGACIYTNIGKFISFSLEKMSFYIFPTGTGRGSIKRKNSWQKIW